MSSILEVLANAFNAACILLAGRNSIHTWWTGIVGCVLFAWVFYETRLYADMTLQGFFVITGAIGWRNWKAGSPDGELLVTRSSPRLLIAGFGLGLLATAGYALLLYRTTDAFAPLPDSAVLAFSVLGQFLLMARRVESWWCWILVNTIAVPLYFMRELYLTAVLYAGFWINALISLRHWHGLSRTPGSALAQGSRPAPETGH